MLRCVAGRSILGWVLAATLASSASATCWEADEYEAARLRDLQTVLMVSALKCGRSMPAMPAAYNAWVARAKASLMVGEQKLLAHFAREGDQRKYDRFTTALANKYSELAEDPAFCKRAGTLMELDETRPGILAEVVLLLNARPNGVEAICPSRKRKSTIIVSPFDPIPVPGPAVASGQSPAAASAPAATDGEAGAPE